VNLLGNVNMKKNNFLKKYNLWITSVILLTLVGCNIQIPSELPKSTKIVSQTFVPSFFPIKTVSPSVCPTISTTVLATYNPTQSTEVIQDFLKKGNDCQLPCFINIIPNQTTIDEAIGSIKQLGYNLEKIESSNNDEFYTTNIGVENKKMSMNIRIWEEENIVKNIDVYINLYWLNELPDPKDWQALSIANILKIYGKPSNIGFFLNFPHEPGFPSNTAWYDVVINYENIDLTIIYSHGLTIASDMIDICPATDQFESISIYLGRNPRYSPGMGTPLQKVSSLNIEEFINLFSQSSETSCILISKQAFIGK
jgi:hypothetical protein